MIYGSCHLEEVSRPSPGVPILFACTMGYGSAMKILGPDSESPQKTGLDTGRTTPFGRGHPTLISATINWSGHIGCYSENFMFLCSNMDSPQKTGLDTSQTIPFGGGHSILISATIIDLAILRAAVRISCFSIQIWILLEKLVQTQVKPYHSEEFTQPSFQPPSLI